MVTPDYQEFANRATAEHRDNTVICGVRARWTCRNQPSVARLPRCQPARKRNFLPCEGWEAPWMAEIAGNNGR